MSEESVPPLNNNLKDEITQKNDSIKRASSEVESTVNSENISASEGRGVKRSLEEDSLKPDLPQVLKDMFKPLRCELCNVIVSSPIVAYTHYEGKIHKKNINSFMKKHFDVENPIKVKNTLETMKCETCDIVVTSEIAYKQHLAGKQHKKRLKNSKHDLVPVSQSEVDPTGRFGIGKAFVKENEQPSQSTSSQPSAASFCEICTVFTDTEEQMIIHKQGNRHSKNIAKLKVAKKSALAHN